MATGVDSGGSNDQLLDGYITCAEKLMAACRESMCHIKGAQKLERMCRSELRYLMKLKKRHVNTNESELKSSNLSHFTGILHSACHFPDVTRLLRPFSLAGKNESLVVDVVAGQGRIWIKVIARKAQALHLIWAGKGQFGERDLAKQAEDYVKCADEHHVCFAPPQVHFVFYNQVTAPMVAELERRGVVVWGERVEVSQEVLDKVQLVEDFSDDDDDDDDVEEEENDNISDDSATDEDDNDENQNINHRLPSSDLSRSCSGIQSLHIANDIHTDTSAQVSKSDSDSEADVHQVNKSSRDASVSSHKSHESQSAVNKGTTDKPAVSKYLDFFAVCDIIPRIITSFPFHSSEDLNQVLQESINRSEKSLNLDITTLITMVSSVTHGGCNFIFPESILTQQAEEERKTPVLPLLNKLLKGKDLFACQTAVESFYSVLNTLGGIKEKERAAEFMKRVRVVPDQPSERTKMLPETGKIKKRSKVIFGTGDELKAITVTANVGFVRAAEHMGISYAVYVIPSRPLTEMKEKLAKPIDAT